MLSGAARLALPRIYVPNSQSNTVDVIDPRTYRVIDHFAVGALPQHVTPSWDLKTLWVDNDQGNSLTPIDPRPASPGTPVPVTDPYNLYFTPDGRYAIVVAERLQRLDFRNAHTHAPAPVADRALSGRRPHGLHRRRPLRDRELRVRRQLVRIDVAKATRRQGSSACSPARCRRTSSSRPTAASSTSPT